MSKKKGSGCLRTGRPQHKLQQRCFHASLLFFFWFSLRSPLLWSKSKLNWAENSVDFSKFYFIKTLMRMLFQQIRMGIWRRKSTMKTLTLIKQSFSTRHLKKVSLRKYFDNVFTAEVPCFIKNTFFITKPRTALSKKLCDDRHYGKMHQAKGGEELNESQSVGTCIETCLSFRLCFQLRQSGFHQIISETKRRSHKRSGKKMKRSGSSDIRFRRAYDCV